MSEPEKLNNFAWRLGVPISKVSRKLGHPKCPPFQARFGPTGRVNYITATPELEHFMRTNPRSIPA